MLAPVRIDVNLFEAPGTVMKIIALAAQGAAKIAGAHIARRAVAHLESFGNDGVAAVGQPVHEGGRKARGAGLPVAAEFLAYMTNPENSAKLAQFFPSPRQSLLNADALAKTNPLLSKAQLQSVVVDGIENGTVIPGHSGFAQIQQLVRAGLDAIWVPDADIGAAMQNICTRISPLLQH